MSNQGHHKVIRQRKTATGIAIVFATSLLLFFQNCSSHDEAPVINQQALLFEQTSAQARKVMRAKCADCHDFATDPVELENLGWIDLGNPEESPMYIDMIDQFEPREGDPL